MAGESSTERDQQINRVIADFLEAERAGRAPDPEELLRQHPDLATELRSFFGDREQFRKVAGPPATASLPTGEATLVPGKIEEPTAGTTRRYFGDYELLEEIARGGMGVVYKARQVSLNRIVALKMILTGQLASDTEVQRFRAEAEAAAQLDHPNIVPIYEVGTQQGQHYFSMKYVEGGSLASFSREPAASAGRQRDLARLVATLARAVHFAHQRGILHRDLKPGNILLQGPGVRDQESGQTPADSCLLTPDSWIAMITDFGLAKRIEGDACLTRSGAIVGTPAYMAPEQARGEKRLSTAIDVYSLGAVLYELLTGRPPFRADTPLETLRQVVEGQPAKPRALNRHINRDLETICLKCLEKDPARRYGTAEALADDLERCCRGEPIAARRAGRIRRFRFWCRRNPLLAAATGAAALAFLATVAVSLYLARSLEESRRLAAGLAFERGLRLCDDGEIAGGLLWLARSLEMAPGRAEDLQRAIRLNLTAWSGQENKLQMIFPELEPKLGARDDDDRRWQFDQFCKLLTASISPDGRILAISVPSGNLGNVVPPPPWETRFWDTDTGQPWGQPISSSGPANVLFMSENKTHLYGGMTRISPDGRTMTIPDSAGFIRLAATATKKEIAKFDVADWTQAVVFSPDSRLALLALGRNEAAFVDTLTGRVVRRLAHKELTALAFSPNGKTAAIGSADGTVRFWDVASGAAVGDPLTVGKSPLRLKFSPNNKYVLVQTDDAVGQAGRLWDVASGQPMGDKLSFQASVHFSPDSTILFAADPPLHVAGCRRWRLTSGVPVEEPFRFPDQGKVLAVAPDGSTMVITQSAGAQVWDTLRAEPVGAPIPSGDPFYACYRPDGGAFLTIGKFASLREGRVEKTRIEARLWEVAPLRPTRISQRHLPPRESGELAVRALAFSPDGQSLLTGGRDGTARVWDLRTGKLRLPPLPQRYHAAVGAVAFSPDSKIMAAASDSEVRLWKTDTGDPVGKPRGNPWEIAEPGFDATGFGRPLVLALSPDGKTVAAACDHGLCLWDVATGERRGKAEKELYYATGLFFTPDGKTITTEPHLRQWDVATGMGPEPALRLPADWACAAVAKDGQSALVGSKEGWVQLWDLAKRQPRGKPFGPGTRRLIEVAFSPDGKVALTRTVPEHEDSPKTATLQLWNLDTGALVGKPLTDLPDRKGANPFSPDGKRVLTVDGDHKVHLWDIASGKELEPPLPDENSLSWWARFSPDGRTILTSPYVERVGDVSPYTVRLWSAHDGKPVGEPLAFSGVRDRQGPWPWHKPTVNPDGTVKITLEKDIADKKGLGPQVGEVLHQPGGIEYGGAAPDKQLIYTVGRDRFLRFWEPRSGKRVGPRLPLPPRIRNDVGLRDDGFSFCADEKDQAYVVMAPANPSRQFDQLWPLPTPIKGEVERLTLWVQVLTGRELDAGGSARELDSAAWHERRQRLEALGGAP
jgi:WD40 repeat protein